MVVSIPYLAIKITDCEKRNLFHRMARAAPEKHEAAVDIPVWVSKALTANRIPAHIRIQRLSYNEKENISGLIGLAATRSMILPKYRKLLHRAARKYDSEIVDPTGDQRRHRV